MAPSTNWPAGARMPIPGNAEAALLIIAAIVISLVALFADSVLNIRCRNDECEESIPPSIDWR